jgi:multidrug resistance efflux pump
MKPIIIDLKDISDSTEVYDAKPNKIFIIFIYMILGMLTIALVWACLWKLDIVIKSNGMFKMEDATNVISTQVTGKVEKVNINEGMYINEGDTILTIEHKKDDEQLELYEGLLAETDERLEMLNGYMDYLNDKIAELEIYKGNSYYQEYQSRADILKTNKDATEQTKDNQIIQYEQNIKNIEESLTYYQGQKDKYNEAINCIKNKINSFSEDDTYYYSLIDNYLMSYRTINEKYKDNESIITEDGKKALSSLELEQITALQQQITSIEGTELTLKGNLDTAQTELSIAKNGTEKYSNETAVLTEKNTISTEITNYEVKKKEYVESVKTIKDNINKCDVKAEYSGYVSIITQVETGQYIQGGTSICEIIPNGINAYYVEVYVPNQDIGMITEGQNVKLEIAAYPASEYGMLVGTVDVVSKDIKVDSSTGSAYYLVKVCCEQTKLYNKEGKSVDVINGMACQAKIITDEQSVIRYVLNKIDLVD